MMLRIFRHYIPVQVLLLVLADIVILFGSMYAGIALRFMEGFGSGYEVHLPIYPRALVFTLVMLGSMTALGLYLRDTATDRFGYLLRFLASFMVGLVIMTLLFYAIPGLGLWRGAFGITVVVAVIGTLIARVVFMLVVNHQILKKRILVLGTGTRAAQVEAVLAKQGLGRKFDLVGFLPAGQSAHHGVDRSKIVASAGSLIATAMKHDIHEIIVGVRDRRSGNLPMAELLECKLEGVNVIEISSFFERETGHVQLDSLNPSWMVFSDGFCRSSSRNLVKRGFDVIVSAMLLVATLPIMLLTAVTIWLESGAPIFYRQTRVGECGRVFAILKFRSMCVDAEKSGQPQWAQKGDSRVTRVGRVIRALRIDELPQIFNVLRGDMSFVGPRPERPLFVDELSKHMTYYSNRHSVKPGITGWAQVNYPYGASLDDAREKLQYDLYYVKNHSLFLDTVILLQTAQVVLFGRGAR
jgi:sugar transferase (PEP-CTERM system associated)